MTKNRLEAFSDGVIAVIITIMVLEMKAPHGVEWSELAPVMPVFLTYILSFVFLGIYWNNHHHLMHAVDRVSGGTLWANMHLLFWLSLIPFATAWMGENHFAAHPVALYGIVLIGCAVSYTILVQILIRVNGKDSRIAHAIGSDAKGWMSLALYVIGVASSSFYPPISWSLYILVALIWLVPDKRIERELNHVHKA